MTRFADHVETLDEARQRNIRDALAEDIGTGDWTGLLVPAGRQVQARVIAREAAVLCGRDWFDGVVRALDPGATIEWEVSEGGWMGPDQTVVTLRGEARALLAAERPALNFIQLLSATATLTRQHVPTRWPALRPCTAAAPSIVLSLVLGIGGGIMGFVVALPIILAVLPGIIGMMDYLPRVALPATVWITIVCCGLYMPILIFLNGGLSAYMKTSWALSYLQLTKPAAPPENLPIPAQADA